MFNYIELVARNATTARETARVMENIKMFCDISVVAIGIIIVVTAVILLLGKKEGA